MSCTTKLVFLEKTDQVYQLEGPGRSKFICSELKCVAKVLYFFCQGKKRDNVLQVKIFNASTIAS